MKSGDKAPISELAEVTWQAPEVGDVLSSYRILDQLSAGGMALIYRAEHIKLRREVALKVLRPLYSGFSNEIRRFFEEARAVNEIDHPHIIDILDFIQDDMVKPPLVYMVMELLSGQDLESVITQKGPLDPRTTLAIAEQAVEALIAIHSKNILHRDLKPSNIFIMQRGGDPWVKLLDFGLVKAFGGRQDLNLTAAEKVVGTPKYMSPEQIRNKPLDARVDVYAMGIVLYEMLAGRCPFEGTIADVLVRHLTDPPPPLSEHRPPGPPVPDGLEAIVMRCLQKEPQDRFQDMKEMHQALVTQGVSCRFDEEASQRKQYKTTLIVHRIKRQRRRAWLAVALLLALVGIGGVLAAYLSGWLAAPSRTASSSPEDLKPAAANPPKPDASLAPHSQPTSPLSGDASLRFPDGHVGPSTSTDGAKKTDRWPARRRPSIRQKQPSTGKDRLIGDDTLDPFAP
jgi:serine/threonine protein kinase